MKLYIVKAYENESKLNTYVDICGYYTSKTALIRAISANRAELGIDKDVNVTALIRNDDFHTLNIAAELGNVEITKTNLGSGSHNQSFEDVGLFLRLFFLRKET